MARPTNSTSTIESVGNREDLEDVIYRVAPEETPFISSIGTDSASAVQHDWQTEDLRAPSAQNKTLEGDNVSTLKPPHLTVRVSNTNQIFTESGGVTNTQQKVKSAGRKNDLNRQKLIKGIELRRDQEMRFIGNYGSKIDESGGTPREAAGALAWLVTNVSRGAGGASGGFAAGVVTAATNGTQRAWSETLLKSVMAQCFTSGARPKQLYMGPLQKQTASGFTGLSQTRVVAKGRSMTTIIAAAEVYVSDFGNLTFIPHAYGLTRDALFIDPELWAVATLRPTETIDLAITGDNKSFELVCEKTLVCRNQKGNGVAADLS